MNDVNIKVRNLGVLPPRTSVSFETEAAIGVTEIDVAVVPKTYVCIDCGWTTKVAAYMNDHQRDQWKHHTFYQRFCRSLHILRTQFLNRNQRVTLSTTITPVIAD